MNWKLAVVALACAYGVWRHWAFDRERSHPPGIVAAEEPAQTNPADDGPFEYKGARITPLADFSITGRLLHKQRYRVGRESDFAPIDFALGWGRMSDTAIIDRLNLRQNFRFVTWSFDGPPPIPTAEIVSHATNMHLVPSTDWIESQLDRVLRGDVVRLSGVLVEISAPDGWKWRSSLSRTDTGGGACEVMWVREVAVVR